MHTRRRVNRFGERGRPERHSATAQPAGTRAWAAAALVPFLALLAGCSREAVQPSAAPAALAVRVIRVEPQELEQSLDITGSLVSPVAVDVKTQFAGHIVQLRKQEGDHVRKGELLALLDETDARLALAQARAALEVAQATLDRVRVAEQAALREGERADNLMRSGGITQRDYDQARVTVRDTQAQVKLAEAQVEQAKKAVAVAEKRLDDCRIISPTSGEIDRKFLNLGGYVDGMTAVYRVVDNQHLELEAYVASAEIAPLAKGQKIRFTVQAFPGEEFDAKVQAIGAAVQPQNRSVMIRASVPNPSGKLKAGMFVKGRLITGTKPDAVIVPIDAVWRRTAEAPYVFVVEQNQARKREVRLGLEMPGAFEIVAGLKPGEVVVAEQNLELAEGVTVTPRS